MEVAGGLIWPPPALSDLTDGATRHRSDAGESGAEVWRLAWAGGDRAYLKWGQGQVAAAVAEEAARLAWLAGRVAVPAVRAFMATADQAWLLIDAMPGRTGDVWLADHPDALPGIIAGCATTMRQWHDLRVDQCPFDAGWRLRLSAARRNVAEGVVDTDDFDADHNGWTAEVVLAEVESLVPATADRVVTHGDFSLGNILFDEKGQVTGMIDVGRAGAADPYQDIAILWQNLGEFGSEWQKMLLAQLGVTAPDLRRLHFHRCLDELF